MTRCWGWSQYLTRMKEGADFPLLPHFFLGLSRVSHPESRISFEFQISFKLVRNQILSKVRSLSVFEKSTYSRIHQRVIRYSIVVSHQTRCAIRVPRTLPSRWLYPLLARHPDWPLSVPNSQPILSMTNTTMLWLLNANPQTVSLRLVKPIPSSNHLPSSTTRPSIAADMIASWTSPVLCTRCNVDVDTCSAAIVLWLLDYLDTTAWRLGDHCSVFSCKLILVRNLSSDRKVRLKPTMC